MRQHYRNLFGSCLLAALILPSQQVAATPLQEGAGGLRTDWNSNGRTGADRGLAGLQDRGASPGNVFDGLADGITPGKLTGATRDPILGTRAPQTTPAQVALAGAITAKSLPPSGLVQAAAGGAAQPGASARDASAVVVASAAQAATVSDAPARTAPAVSLPATPSFGAPSPGSTGAPLPATGFSAPRPAMPQALTEAVNALSQKKPEDAIRLARTFISQADAKGPGPETTPPVMGLAHEIVATGLAVQGKQDEAIVELQKALSANPGQGSAQFKLGVIYREQGKLQEAKAALEKASATMGGDPVKIFLGDVNERLGDVPAAIQIFEPMLSGPQGQDPKFNIHLASLYNRVNRFADAIKLLQPVVTVDSKDADGLMTLGFAYGGSGKPKEGLPLLVAAKALAPDNWRIDLALGTLQREVGELDAAEASLKRVVAAEPKLAQARFQLALVQMAKSQFPEASDTLLEASKLAPAAVEVTQLRGDALFRSGKKDEAIALFKELAARDGAAVNDYVNLARVYQASDRLDDAARVYRETLQKFLPANPGIYALLGGVQAQQKKYPEARQTIATGRKLTPDDPRLLRALIQIESAAGDLKAALPVAQRLVDTQPKSLEDRFALATLYGRLGDRKRAITIYRAILADAPESAVVMNNLASALTDDGDAKGALPLAKRAQELEPQSPATNDTLGWALLKAGQSKEALPLFETATQMAPTNAELLYHLGMAQKALNNPKAARASLEKALALSTDFDGNADAKAALASLPK